MDCKRFKSIVEPYLKNGAAKKKMSSDVARHLQNCALCRDTYAALFDSENDHNQIIPDHAEIKKINPTDEDPSDRFPDISEPVEFKDAPITFTLRLDDRKEEIKVVEPEVDLPFPEGGKLEVREKDACLTDVVFKFNPASDRPYELHFTTLKGVRYPAEHVRSFGSGKTADDKDLLKVYSMSIIERGGLQASIEMTQGKARIHIQYAPQGSV